MCAHEEYDSREEETANDPRAAGATLGFRVHGTSRDPLANPNLRILVYLVIYDSGWVSLEHLVLAWQPSQEPKQPVIPTHQSGRQPIG